MKISLSFKLLIILFSGLLGTLAMAFVAQELFECSTHFRVEYLSDFLSALTDWLQHIGSENYGDAFVEAGNKINNPATSFLLGIGLYFGMGISALALFGDQKNTIKEEATHE